MESVFPNLAQAKKSQKFFWSSSVPLLQRPWAVMWVSPALPQCLNTPVGPPYRVTAGGNEVGAEALGYLQHRCPVLDK